MWVIKYSKALCKCIPVFMFDASNMFKIYFCYHIGVLTNQSEMTIEKGLQNFKLCMSLLSRNNVNVRFLC